MKLLLVKFSVRHPWVVLAISALLTLGFLWQFPQVHFDNDPENMLSPDEPVRRLHHEVKERYALYDFVIVGVVNERDPAGVFNVATLQRIHRLTQDLLSLERSSAGRVTVRRTDAAGQVSQVELPLRHTGWFRQVLGWAFSHNPEDLFDAAGQPVIIGREILAPSVVDNLRQAELGALKLEYLMEAAPKDQAEADRIRRDALENPLLKEVLAAGDGKALALYLPITAKVYSYNVANLVRVLTADWPAEDQVHITGLPVAEDTFGIEMLRQMVISAPLAALTIFVLLWLFFRKLSLIIAPMVTAMLSVMMAMGLLIGLGYDVHIMSSMIPIFLMPIAVVDAIHILSEFHDTYRKYHDKAKTLEAIYAHLFMPMLYTSLTTIAGFASLATTPIPPVQVFGLHVAFGVAVAWVLTMTLIPAMIMVTTTPAMLETFGKEHHPEADHGLLPRLLAGMGRLTASQWKLIIVATVALLVVAGYGISRINVNDNPVKWFVERHEIRVADKVLNAHFGGTYPAYLSIASASSQHAAGVGDLEHCMNAGDHAQASDPLALAAAWLPRQGAQLPPAVLQGLLAELTTQRPLAGAGPVPAAAFWEALGARAAALDESWLADWRALADTLEGLDATAELALASQLPDNPARAVLLAELPATLKGQALLEAALAACDRRLQHGARDLISELEAELSAPLFKRPAVLAWLADLQAHLVTHRLIGKTTSTVDALRKAHYELRYQAPAADMPAAELSALATANQAHFSIPGSPSALAQVYTQLEGMKKKDSLFHLVTRDYQEANLWIQLKSGDNRDMEAVLEFTREFVASHPPPVPLRLEWAGLTYLNVVWQDKMVTGMFSSLASSFVIVLVMMIVLFRSFLWGLLCMLPLSLTIALIYGIIGLVGKDYDMPVAVLSSLTLGLSVDFAIHFLERAREATRQAGGDWRAAAAVMFAEPAMAITRNGVVIAIGFLPLLAAPLLPYRTVGFFMAAIMALSGLATLLLLPALLTALRRWLWPPAKTQE